MRYAKIGGPAWEHLSRRDAAIDFDWKMQPPVEDLGYQYFSVRWEGYLLAPTTGEYEFSTVMDDGLRVWVGGKRIIDAWKEQDHVPAVVHELAARPVWENRAA